MWITHPPPEPPAPSPCYAHIVFVAVVSRSESSSTKSLSSSQKVPTPLYKSTMPAAGKSTHRLINYLIKAVPSRYVIHPPWPTATPPEKKTRRPQRPKAPMPNQAPLLTSSSPWACSPAFLAARAGAPPRRSAPGCPPSCFVKVWFEVGLVCKSSSRRGSGPNARGFINARIDTTTPSDSLGEDLDLAARLLVEEGGDDGPDRAEEPGGVHDVRRRQRLGVEVLVDGLRIVGCGVIALSQIKLWWWMRVRTESTRCRLHA